MVLDDGKNNAKKTNNNNTSTSNNNNNNNKNTSINVNSRLADLNGWKAAEKTKSLEGYQKYISTFPSGAFISKPKQKEKIFLEETEWEIANMLGTKDAYQKYIDDYPKGMYRKEAISQRKKTLKKVGERHQGGSIFQIDASGDHGLVCIMKQT
ncbi:MAG: hypothetical protein ACI8YQ_005193 [Polaribacter sp.]|jgi:hypothetical protein